MSCAKVVGIETEYANAIIGKDVYESPSRLLLGALHGNTAHRGYGRDFLPNGMRAYEDHSHIEVSTQECRSAMELTSAVIAADRLVDQARQVAQESLPSGQRLIVVADNCDRQGNAYACHLNVLVERKVYDQLFQNRPHLLYEILTPYLVTIPVIAGAGKVGSENNTPPATYQLSQRADHIELAAPDWQTTSHRPLINTRDEPLADRERYARLHVIPLDTNRHPFALYLKAGTLQLIVALLESQVLEDRRYLDRALTLRHPIAALHTLSRDLSLRAEIPLEDGRQWTALQIQEELLAGVRRYIESTPDVEEIVPGASQICAAWADTLQQLKNWNTEVLMRRVDWVAKYLLLERQAQRKGWDDPSLKVLDIQYGNINPEEGLFHALYEKNGRLEQVVSEERIAYLMHHAPETTRAYMRAECVRRFGDELDSVDWDSIRVWQGSGWWPHFTGIALDDPLRHTKAQVAPILEQIHSVEELIETFGTQASPALQEPAYSAFEQGGSGLYLPQNWQHPN